MDERLFSVLIFVIFLGLILVVAYVFLVPIKNENACVKYCLGKGFKGGFCVEVTRGSYEVTEVETRENANATDAQCLWNPISKDMVKYPMCFCRNE